MSPKAFWRDAAQRRQAHRIRVKHPKWSNEHILGYINAMDEVEKDRIKSQVDVQKDVRKRRKDSTYNDKNLLRVPLPDLIDNFNIPTGYVSPLSDADWCTYYLGNTMLRHPITKQPGVIYKVQAEVFDFLKANIMAAVDIWRGSGKTVGAEGFILRRMCDNTDNKFALITEEQKRSEQRVMVLKQELQTNPRLIRDYGYLPHDKAYKGYRGRWSASMLQLKRNIIAQEPTLIGLSQGAKQMLGYHFTGVLIDDPWSEELQAQKGAKEKWMTWFQGTFLGCVEMGAFIWMLFTRKGVNDLYSDIIYERGFFKVIRRPAITKYPSKYKYVFDAKGKPVFDQKLGVPAVNIISKDGVIYDSCNGRFSMPFFLGKKKLAGNLKFEQEFQCNPMPLKGALLDWDLLKFYNDPTNPLPYPEDPKDFWDKIRWVAMMDQAFGMSDRADYTVISVIGEYGNRYYLDKIYRGRWTTTQKIQKIQECYDTYHPSQFGIESNLIQMTIAKEIISSLPNISLKEINPRGKGRDYKLAIGAIKEYEAKIYRIYDQTTPVLERGQFYVNAQMDNFDHFEREFRYLGGTTHDDIMDAIGNTLEMIDREGIHMFFMGGNSSVSRFRTI